MPDFHIFQVWFQRRLMLLCNQDQQFYSHEGLVVVKESIRNTPEIHPLTTIR